MSRHDVLRADTPTPDTQRITEMWVWVAIQPGEGEGIISAEVSGLGHMPLVTSKERVARNLMPEFAERARMLMPAGSSIELRRFKAVP